MSSFPLAEGRDMNITYHPTAREEGSDWNVIQCLPSVGELKKISFPTEVAQSQVTLDFGRQRDGECCEQLVHRLVILKVIGRWASCAHCSCKQLLEGDTRISFQDRAGQ